MEKSLLPHRIKQDSRHLEENCFTGIAPPVDPVSEKGEQEVRLIEIVIAELVLTDKRSIGVVLMRPDSIVVNLHAELPSELTWVPKFAEDVATINREIQDRIPLPDRFGRGQLVDAFVAGPEQTVAMDSLAFGALNNVIRNRSEGRVRVLPKKTLLLSGQSSKNT